MFSENPNKKAYQKCFPKNLIMQRKIETISNIMRVDVTILLYNQSKNSHSFSNQSTYSESLTANNRM